jgi:transcriptional regulator with XRE-family HTH domain
MAPSEPTGRRRTPGLRREELAARAGISTIWCAWIEQGRDIQASPKTLARLARALALSPEDRARMFELAGRTDPERAAPAPEPDVPASLVAVIAGLDHPAYALDRLWNARYWNAAAARLLEGWLGEGRERNFLRFVFLDPATRSLVPQWQDWARRVLEEFRADANHHLDDPAVRALIEAMRRESPVFAAAWDEAPLLSADPGLRSFHRPGGGVSVFEQSSFNLASHPDYKLVILTPTSAAQTAFGAAPEAPETQPPGFRPMP